MQVEKFASGLAVAGESFQWLAKAKRSRVHAECPSSPCGPAFEGDPAAFAGDNTVLQVQLRNKVKKCPVCSKPNAFLLPFCNGCSNDLSKVEVSFSHNIFSSFAFGIARGPFPFTISLRKQTEEFIVFDDLLALSKIHLNVIPTTTYVSDWTRLLARPKKGLELVESMFDQCWSVVKEQFWPHRALLFRDGDTLDLEQLKKLVVCGLNFPPSQFQLHLQFMVPPFLPFQWLACQKGIHFTKNRFFPISYVQRVLACPQQFEWKEGSTIEELVAFYKERYGIDYEEVHAAEYKAYFAAHEKLANWVVEDFEGVVEGTRFLPFGPDGLLDSEKGADVSVDAVAAADKLVLQNYGRPYSNGKPNGTYYKFPKKEMEFF